ncbi:MAG: tetratricopeptide repeat protein [Candidatus Neomarinimicrobiota bacterium]
MNYKNRQELEEYFAENFHSELFPILSEHYLLDGDLDRAERVCDIGLRLNENSVLGFFIKSRILMAQKDFFSTEQYLKKVISADPGFLNALLLMLDVQSKLKRSKQIRKQCCDEILGLDPRNPQAKQALDQLSKRGTPNKVKKKGKLNDSNKRNRNEEKKRRKKKLKDSSAVKSGGKKKARVKRLSMINTTSARASKEVVKQKSEANVGFNEFAISPKLATFTLVRVLKTQKLYDQALKVLSIMSKKEGVNKNNISQEKKLIISLIEAEGSN